MSAKKKYFTEEEKRIAHNERQKKYRETHKKEINEYYQENKEKLKRYYQENKEEKLLKAEEYRQTHREEINLKANKSYQTEPRKEYVRNYSQTHKKERNEYINNRLKTDINFKLAWDLRSRTRKAIKGNFKSGSAVEDLGCLIPFFKLYLEALFKPGMTWDNWSFRGWHIDHIIPLDSFNLSNREEFLKACHYTNLQPLWAEENWKKGVKFNCLRQK